MFRIIKCQFGYTKVRYKGLAKNRAQVFAWMGLTTGGGPPETDPKMIVHTDAVLPCADHL